MEKSIAGQEIVDSVLTRSGMTQFRIVHGSDFHIATREGLSNPTEHAGRPTLLAVAQLIAGVRFGAFSDAQTLADIFPGWGNAFYPSTFLRDRFIQFAHYVVDHAYAIDAVVLTGDLATTGRLLDLQRTREVICGVMPNTWHPVGNAPAIVSAPSAVEVVMMPGNHDRFSTHDNKPGGTNFESVFGANWDASQELMTSASSRVKSAVFEKDARHLAVCCADFTLRSAGDADADIAAFNYLSQGMAYADILSEVSDETTRLRSEFADCAVIWAIHFPPEFPHSKQRMKLLNAHSVSEAAQRCEVNMILSGHHHDQLNYNVDSVGGLRVFAAGTPCSVERDGIHSFFDLHIVTAGSTIANVEVVTVVFDPDQDQFIPGNAETLTFSANDCEWRLE